MRTALIIGAAGQDGRLLAGSLVGRGYRVLGVTRTPAPSPLPCECLPTADLTSLEGVESILRRSRPDEIYYLAAFHQSAEDTITLDREEIIRRSYEIHVYTLLRILDAMGRLTPQARLFYAASSHVFGEPVTEWQDEQTPLAPTNPYGFTKALGMFYCRWYRARQVYASTGILYNHESPLRRPAFLSRKIVLGAQRAKADHSFRLTLGNLDARVDWGYAPDYVDAMERILQLSEPDDFVLATGETHSVREFAEEAFGALDLDWRDHVETDPALLKKPHYTLRGDASKLRAATGWQPRVSFREMVSTLVHAENPSHE